MMKLADLFQLASLQFQPGLIRESVFIQWLRAAHIAPDVYSLNLIGIDQISSFFSYRTTN